MNDKFNQFFNQYNNQSVEAEDPSALDQCMDLAFKYCDFLAIDRAAIRHQYAYQIWDQANATTRQYFDLFPNTTTFIPQTGDIAVFGIVNGIPVGHVSIVGIGSNINDLTSFDQNWDTLHYYHTVTINGVVTRIPYSRTVVHAGYYGVKGFLRPKASPVNWDDIRQKMLNALNAGGTSQDRCANADKIFHGQ